MGKISDVSIPHARQTSWTELLQHVGHKIEAAGYHLTCDPDYPLAVSLECRTCNQVLVCHSCSEDRKAKKEVSR